MKLKAIVSAECCYLADARDPTHGFACDWNQLTESLHREVNMALCNVPLRISPRTYEITFEIKLKKGQKKNV